MACEVVFLVTVAYCIVPMAPTALMEEALELGTLAGLRHEI